MKTFLVLLFLAFLLFTSLAPAGQLEIYIDQSTSVDQPQLRLTLAHAVKELSGVPNTRIKIIGFFADGWNPEVLAEILIPPAPPNKVECGKPTLSDLARISRAQRIKEEAEFRQACARRADEELLAYRKALADAGRQLQESVQSTIDRKPAGRCSDIRGVLDRAHRRAGSHEEHVVVLVVSDMRESCASLTQFPDDGIRGRVFIAPVQPAKSQSTAGEYFLEVERRLRRIAPWARVIPASFGFSEVLDALRQ